ARAAGQCPPPPRPVAVHLPPGGPPPGGVAADLVDVGALTQAADREQFHSFTTCFPHTHPRLPRPRRCSPGTLPRPAAHKTRLPAPDSQPASGISFHPQSVAPRAANGATASVMA